MRSLRIAAGMATLLFMGPLLADDPSASPQQAIEKAQVLEHKAADKDPAPVPKAQTITPPEAQAVDPVGEKPVDDTLTCLARTIYWEAKGGTPADMQAVAHVVLNRLGHEGFPDSVCEVVKQGADKKVCQFSWWCDGRSDQVQEEKTAMGQPRKSRARCSTSNWPTTPVAPCISTTATSARSGPANT